MSESKTIFLCSMCRRQFDRKKLLNTHCCSSVQYEPPVKKTDGKKRGLQALNTQAKSAERVGEKRDGWSQEEESLLETGVMEFGNNWTLILYKYGSSFRIEHQHPTMLSAKWDNILKKRDAETKPCPKPMIKTESTQSIAQNDENGNESLDASARSGPATAAASSAASSAPSPSSTPTPETRLKPLLVITPQSRGRKRRGADEDDEDYVPELGAADSDSDTSHPNKIVNDPPDSADEEEEEEEEEEDDDDEEYESEDDEEQLTTAAKTTIDNQTSTIHNVSIPVSIQDPTTSSFITVSQRPETSAPYSVYVNDPLTPSFALPVCAIQPDAGNPSASIVEAAAAAAGLASDDNSASTYYQLVAEEGGTAAYAVPISVVNALSDSSNNRVSATTSIASTSTPVPSTSSSSTPSAPSDLPLPFQNLINSEDYHRLIQFSVNDVLRDQTNGYELLEAVLSELARILASMYPGQRDAASAAKFSDSLCIPWLRTFLPQFASLPESEEVMFAGQDTPRPVLSAIQAKVKSIFLFYLNVMPQTNFGNH